MKSQYLVYAIIALVIAGVAYWVFMGKGPAYTTPDSTTASPTGTSMSPWVVQLGAQNASNESGTATLTEADGKTTVVISVTGEAKGSVQPAHIHMGACPTPGSVVYPLTNVVDGQSTTTVMATIAELKAKLPLAINLHTSAAEMSKYVACGDLK